MYQEGEDRFYYIMLYNEDYVMPEMPAGTEDGIIKGIYKLKAAEGKKGHGAALWQRADLNEAVRAQSILAEKYGVQADVWERNQLQRTSS